MRDLNSIWLAARNGEPLNGAEAHALEEKLTRAEANTAWLEERLELSDKASLVLWTEIHRLRAEAEVLRAEIRQLRAEKEENLK